MPHIRTRLRSLLPALTLALLGLVLLLWPQIGQAQRIAPQDAPPPLSATQAEVLTKNAARLHPQLLRQLLENPDTADLLPIVVEWKRDTDMVLAPAMQIPDVVTRRGQVVQMLQADAAAQSAALQSVVAQAVDLGLATDVHSFWVSPIMAMNARPALIQSLAQRKDVVQVRLDRRIDLDAGTLRRVEAAEVSGFDGPSQEMLWNLQMIQVDLAETALGLDGTGTVVAIMDTGVDWQHPILINQYRGYNPKGPAIHAGNWHVSTDEPYLYPGDGYGHGTHVAGTIVGDDLNGIRTGVAPGAKWIAVKIFNNTGFTYESWIHDGFQWLMAPDGDPALAPDVVNSSWGSSDGYDETFRPDVQALRAAGILPVFSAGNAGPTKGSISSPAGFPAALAVAAVDQERLPASFSSRGPSPWGEIKPELAAPGVNIFSSYLGGFALSDGTSMAAPHVTGVAALIYQANPQLTPDQMEEILAQTATPLGSKVPNNDTGVGLVSAYAAGLRVTQSGELRGQVMRSVGGNVAYPRITATPRGGDAPVTILGDASGAFTVALRPGMYDVTGSAFGFNDAVIYGQIVETGKKTFVPVPLALQPVGTIFGRVTDAKSGIPLAATITVSGTPVSVRSDANNGTFSVALPQGTWDLRIQATGHRIQQITRPVTIGVGSEINPALTPAPTILLVDTGRWYYRSQVQPILDSLEKLAYPVDLHTVRNPFGILDMPTDLPTTDQMAAYDLVIWSAPLDSPSYIDADSAVQGFLDQGGRILFTGQEIAYWDAGGSIVNISQYFPYTLGAWFKNEKAVETMTGTLASPLAGLTVTLNIDEPPYSQGSPDSVEIQNAKTAHPLMTWPDGSAGAMTSGTCQAFRAAWLGFGLQGIQNESQRETLLDRLISWSQAAPASQGVLLAGPGGPAVGYSGETITHTISVDSLGVDPGRYDIQIQGSGEGASWPVSLKADGKPVGPEMILELGACESRTLVVSVTLPPNLTRDQKGIHTIRLVNRANSAISAQVTLTSKTPAPILLVDDERFYNYEDRYQQALDGAGLGYDTFVATNDRSPSLETLYKYPTVIWFTGYDWFQPVSEVEQSQLATYLDTGGRLLLSSQDLLDLHGANPFVQTYLGVQRPLWTITATDVAPIVGSPLGQDIGPFLLDYPIPNWSDGLQLTIHAQAALEDEHGYTVAALTRGDRWRSAFFPFPLESMADADLSLLMGRTLTWLGPFGGSRLTVPTHARAGEQIPLTLTLTTQEKTPQPGASVRLPLPAGTTVINGSVQGGWSYSSATHTLTWSGTLLPETPRTLQVQLNVAPGVAERTRLRFDARMETQDTYASVYQSATWVNSPWLVVGKQVGPPDARPGDTVGFTLTLDNQGAIPAQAVLVDPLPAEISLLPDTVQISLGSVDVVSDVDGTVITWRSTLTQSAQAQLTFRAVISPTVTGGPVRNRAVVTDINSQRWAAYADFLLPKEIFMPWVAVSR
ncbi:MAG: S8 family serine peptidase [Caldilineaceae bacterium]|nr:S8 family serine peptidase [Caldilineaceae bacterium]